MSNADLRGRFIWHDLMTTDPGAASAFYSRVVGWKTQPSEQNPSYTLWMTPRGPVGGLVELPADERNAGTPPYWRSYVATPDVRATVQAAQGLGARVVKDATDIPGVGTYAVLEDPQGAMFAIFSPAPHAAEGIPSRPAIGEFSWHELSTTDPEAALRFYTELFGWGKGSANDMGGDLGIYHIFTHGGTEIGGIYKSMEPSVPPHWLPYVRVPDAARAANAVKAAGGRVINGPMEVPGGDWIVQLLDPLGAAFAVHEVAQAAAAKPAPGKAAPARKPQAAAAKAAPEKSASARKPQAPKPAAARAEPPASQPAAGETSAEAQSAAPPSREASAKKRAPARAAGKAKSAGKRSAARRAAAKRKQPAARKRAGAKSTRKKASAARRAKAVKKAARRVSRTRPAASRKRAVARKRVVTRRRGASAAKRARTRRRR